jgi:aminopeptidase N
VNFRAALHTAGGADPYVPGHGDPSYDVESYDLELDYRVASNHLDARAEIVAVARTAVDVIAFDLVGLDVGKVTVDGRRPAKFSARGHKLKVHLAEPIVAGQRVTRVRCAAPGATSAGRSSPTASSSPASPAGPRRGSPATTGPTPRRRTGSA